MRGGMSYPHTKGCTLACLTTGLPIYKGLVHLTRVHHKGMVSVAMYHATPLYLTT